MAKSRSRISIFEPLYRESDAGLLNISPFLPTRFPNIEGNGKGAGRGQRETDRLQNVAHIRVLASSSYCYFFDIVSNFYKLGEGFGFGDLNTTLPGHNFNNCLEHVSLDKNSVAINIVISVTIDHRYQSYLANGGPRWLKSTIGAEAANGVSMS
ncbi:hypothetical protein YC2023_007472 [Brassica napus]